MFLSHIHIFRAFAIIGIVGAHTLHAFSWNDNPLMFRFFDTLFNQSSVLFFFIAGFLFQYLGSRFEKWNYWKKKIQYVIVPYLLLSVPALYYYTQISIQDNTWPGFYDQSTAMQVVHFLLTGKHLSAFWFVPTIALFYIIAPLLISADRDRRIYWLLPILMTLSFVMGRDGDYLFFIENESKYGQFNKAIYLFSVYLFGMFCSVHHEKVLAFMQKFHLPILALTVFAIITNVYITGYGQQLLYLSKTLMCPLFIFYLFKTKEVFDNKLDYLAHISFGIFFIHSYILPVIKMSYTKITNQVEFPEGDLPTYLLVTLAVTALCMITIYICQKVTGKYSRMVLGA